jgi:hypothetical protein
MKPEGDVDHGIDVRPERGRQGRTLLLGEAAAPERQQVTEVARITPGVTEYRRPCLGWVAWGTYPQAAWPATRPRVQATGGYVTGRLGASQREVPAIVATRYQTEVSSGSSGALEQAVSAALAVPGAEAQTYVQRQPVRNADERSWREKTKRRWLWIRVTPLVTSLRLLKTRGAAGAKELLGEVGGGVSGRIITRGITGLIRASAHSAGRS